MEFITNLESCWKSNLNIPRIENNDPVVQGWNHWYFIDVVYGSRPDSADVTANLTRTPAVIAVIRVGGSFDANDYILIKFYWLSFWLS